MKIISTRITNADKKTVGIEMLLADSAEAEAEGAFLKFRLSIPFDEVVRVPKLQLVALRSARELIDEQIRSLQSVLGRHNIDIP